LTIRRISDMPHATIPHGVHLFYEETGAGTPVILVHEFAGDYRSWEASPRSHPQLNRSVQPQGLRQEMTTMLTQ
jgi:hypothetical protein